MLENNQIEIHSYCSQAQPQCVRILLRQMRKDQSGTIAAVKARGELGLRIREMGLIPGTRVTVQGRAPLYDPVALRIMGCTLTLRNHEADFIAVDLD